MISKKKILVILGPAGSGKSTQADLISKSLNYTQLSMGSILREEVKKKTTLSKKLNTILNKGELVPYEISCDLLFKKIKKIKKNKILVDGFPRQIEQAIVFNYYLYTNNYELENIIYVDVHRRECVRRLIERKRKDDTKKAINERLYLYVKETKKVLEKYNLENKLVHIDGNKAVDVVFSEILKKLKK